MPGNDVSSSHLYRSGQLPEHKCIRRHSAIVLGDIIILTRVLEEMEYAWVSLTCHGKVVDLCTKIAKLELYEV